MKKLKYLFWTLIALLALALVNQSPVQAADLTIVPSRGSAPVVWTGTSVYLDPQTTENTGRTLPATTYAWKVFAYAKDETGNVVSYNLGGDQWAKTSELRKLDTYAASWQNAMSLKSSIPVYSDPLMTDARGSLNPTISHWKILAIARYGGNSQFSGQAYQPAAVALGKNQWVRAEDVLIVPATAFFTKGTPLFNSHHQQTGTIKASDSYVVYGSKAMANTTYVRLGNDSQWAAYTN